MNQIECYAHYKKDHYLSKSLDKNLKKLMLFSRTFMFMTIVDEKIGLQV